MPARKTATTSKKTTAKKSILKSTSKISKASMTSKKGEVRQMGVSNLKKKVLAPQNRRSLVIAVIVIVILIILYLIKGLFVAALVNGQPISRIGIIHDLEQQSGGASLDAAITRTLVFQEARKKNVTVSDKEIDAEIAKIDSQFKSQGQDLNQLLATQGLTKDKFRDEVKVQLIVQKILGNQVKVSDQEFKDFLAKNQDLIANEKDKATAEANLRQQLEQQKLAQAYQTWIANLKKNAQITKFVNY